MLSPEDRQSICAAGRFETCRDQHIQLAGFANIAAALNLPFLHILAPLSILCICIRRERIGLESRASRMMIPSAAKGRFGFRRI
ncbi:hypothetical protein ACMAY8_07290 [Rhodobacteraceae bacterium nBUS_22]